MLTGFPFIPFFFFFNDTAPTEIYPLSLHDALPISFVAAAPSADVEPDVSLGGATKNLRTVVEMSGGGPGGKMPPSTAGGTPAVEGGILPPGPPPDISTTVRRFFVAPPSETSGSTSAEGAAATNEIGRASCRERG